MEHTEATAQSSDMEDETQGYEDRFKQTIEERLFNVERRLAYLEQVMDVQKRGT